MSYIALFLTPNLNVIGQKKFKPIDTFVNFKKGTFNIRLDAYLYKIKDTTIYGYIYPTDEKLLIDCEVEPIKIGNKISSARLVKIQEELQHGDLHLLVSESIIGQLARAFLSTVKTNWILIIFVLIGGIVSGYLACSLINPKTITEIISNSTISATPTLTPYPYQTPTIIRP